MAPFLLPRHVYADLNSVAPTRTQDIDKVVSATGARFVEVAVMAVVPHGHRVPMLPGGRAAASARRNDDAVRDALRGALRNGGPRLRCQDVPEHHRQRTRGADVRMRPRASRVQRRRARVRFTQLDLRSHFGPDGRRRTVKGLTSWRAGLEYRLHRPGRFARFVVRDVCDAACSPASMVVAAPIVLAQSGPAPIDPTSRLADGSPSLGRGPAKKASGRSLDPEHGNGTCCA